MLASASRAGKPKLSLSISTASTSSRPSLSLKSPMTMGPRTPISPAPLSPTARNTRLNGRGFATQAAAPAASSFAYANSSSAKSILKKGQSMSSAAASKKIQFSGEPTVYCVTPVAESERDGYYGKHVKMTRDERRWGRSS